MADEREQLGSGAAAAPAATTKKLMDLEKSNRAAAESVNAAFQNAGPQMFEAKAAESMGLSELAARQVLERVKAAMNALADQGQSLSLANGGSGGAVNKIA